MQNLVKCAYRMQGWVAAGGMHPKLVRKMEPLIKEEPGCSPSHIAWDKVTVTRDVNRPDWEVPSIKIRVFLRIDC